MNPTSLSKSGVSADRSLLDLYICIKNKLSFILYEISEEKLVYTVFEVLNSRGIEVSWFDRLKSMLMGSAFEIENIDKGQLITELHDTWSKIFRIIGLRQGMSTEALRFAATLYRSNSPSRPLGERDSVDEFRRKANDPESIRSAADWIYNVVDVYNKVISNRRQSAVTRILQARLLAVSLYLREDIKDVERGELLERWEKISFRIYGMMGKDARYHVGEYTKLAWSITQDKITVNEINQGLNKLAELAPISDAIDEIRNANCYDGWQDELRYFMFRYEENLAAEQNLNFSNEQWEKIWEVSPSTSIEHILPQSKASENLKHRLGNLMILPPKLNSKLQDKPLGDKLEAYRTTGLLVAGEVVEQVGDGRRQWTKKQIETREEKILNWAKTEWGD